MPPTTANDKVTFALEYEDEHLLVVTKRSGLVTQPGKGHEDDSLLNGLFVKYGSKLGRLGEARDCGLLHRLDRETSGLLVVALSAKAYDGLRKQFEDRKVQKFYWAVCAKAPKHPSGMIDKPIAETTPRGYTEKKLAKITAKGKSSTTAYRVLSQNDQGALVECRPLTGRLHQVRVHLCSIGCPLFGDGLYSPPAIATMGPRLALHAHRLAFAHPVTGQVIDVRTPFPKDLRPLLNRLKLTRPE
jgi:23S rRNA pseudouridine1911/1915/1917 synthase